MTRIQKGVKRALHYAYAEALGHLFDRLSPEERQSNNEFTLDVQKKLALYHVKYLPNTKDNSLLSKEELENKFRVFDLIHLYLSRFTPREFMQYFPIEKKYKGKKYGTKDYFSTINYLMQLNLDEQIGENRIDHFLWEYMNWDIADFETERFCTASDLRVARGGKDIMEEWCEKEGIPTLSVLTDKKGKMTLQNNQTGEVMEVKEHKRRPKWIHAVK